MLTIREARVMEHICNNNHTLFKLVPIIRLLYNEKI
jgi:hypothetical protein